MKNQRWLRPVRIILALSFFIGFLLLFSDVLGTLPSMFFEVFTSFQFLPSIVKFSVIPKVLTTSFIIVLLLTVFSGRVYCSVFCPLGILQDALIFIKNRFSIKYRSRKFKKALNYVRYPILGLTIISLLFTGILAIVWLDPYANFGRIASNLYQPVFIVVRNLTANILMAVDIYTLQPIAQKVFYPLPFFLALSILLLILLMVFYRDRLFCNTICPLGTFLGLLSKFSFLKISIEKTSCSHCGNCQAACKANCINIKQMTVDESRCVSCFNCINVCEESGIGFKKSWIKSTTGQLVTDITKRDFLKAGFIFLSTYPLLLKAENNQENHPSFCKRGPISPPGSISIEHLKEKCIGCQLCISVCPTKVLQPSFLEYGFTGMMLPRMVNSVGFCNYECVKCTEVCPTHAIIPLSTDRKKTVQVGKVYFNKDLCIVTTRSTSCGSCSEHCPTQAVYMVPYRGALTIPETNSDICIGCGACEYACPAHSPHVAIYVVPNKVHQVARKPVNEEIEIQKTEEFPF